MLFTVIYSPIVYYNMNSARKHSLFGLLIYLMYLEVPNKFAYLKQINRWRNEVNIKDFDYFVSDLKLYDSWKYVIILRHEFNSQALLLKGRGGAWHLNLSMVLLFSAHFIEKITCYTTVYHSVVNRNKLLVHVTTWMGLKCIRLNERSQMEKEYIL